MIYSILSGVIGLVLISSFLALINLICKRFKDVLKNELKSICIV